jgi:hypothetical protein
LYTDAELALHGFTAWHPGDLSDWAPEAVVLMTGHSAFADLDLIALREAGLQVVVDGRRFWRWHAVKALGLTYVGMGLADMPLTRYQDLGTSDLQ